MVITSMLAVALAGTALAAGSTEPAWPAPNSGDGVHDGSGFDGPNGQIGDGTSGSGSGPSGPAPNSGDGVPDGSGMDSPNGPND